MGAADLLSDSDITECVAEYLVWAKDSGNLRRRQFLTHIDQDLLEKYVRGAPWLLSYASAPPYFDLQDVYVYDHRLEVRMQEMADYVYRCVRYPLSFIPNRFKRPEWDWSASAL